MAVLSLRRALICSAEVVVTKSLRNLHVSSVSLIVDVKRNGVDRAPLREP